METIPHDETGAAIRQWAMEGSDITKPMKIDFFVALPSQSSGSSFASDKELAGFIVSVEEDADTKKWTCYCTKVIVPTYSNIVEIERQLAAVAARYGAELDGFGSFGNSEA